MTDRTEEIPSSGEVSGVSLELLGIDYVVPENAIEIASLILTLVALLGVAYATWNWGKTWYVWCVLRLRRLNSSIPRETMRIVPNSKRCFFSDTTTGGRPTSQVTGAFNITNISDQHLRIMRVHLTTSRTDGNAWLEGGSKDEFNQEGIAPNQTSVCDVTFFTENRLRSNGSEKRLGVTFTDQYGNEHRVKKVPFKARTSGKQKPREAKAPVEKIADISNVLEKNVAAILKSEITKYEGNGRRTGGLGSLEIVSEKERTNALGGQTLNIGHEKNSLVLIDEEKVEIRSENLSALLAMHDRLETEEDRAIFVNSLLGRLKRNTEYACVAYIIGIVLLRIGKFSQMLAEAKNGLMGDSAWGFSDLLIAMDGLLKLRNSWFSDHMLDELEHFVEDINDVGSISKRIIEIRAHRAKRV